MPQLRPEGCRPGPEGEHLGVEDGMVGLEAKALPEERIRGFGHIWVAPESREDDRISRNTQPQQQTYAQDTRQRGRLALGPRRRARGTKEVLLGIVSELCM